jgi:hypothetical protein
MSSLFVFCVALEVLRFALLVRDPASAYVESGDAAIRLFRAHF